MQFDILHFERIPFGRVRKAWLEKFNFKFYILTLHQHFSVSICISTLRNAAGTAFIAFNFGAINQIMHTGVCNNCYIVWPVDGGEGLYIASIILMRGCNFPRPIIYSEICVQELKLNSSHSTASTAKCKIKSNHLQKWSESRKFAFVFVCTLINTIKQYKC